MRLFQEHGTTVPLAARLITLARFPVFRTVARQLLAVADFVREPCSWATLDNVKDRTRYRA